MYPQTACLLRSGYNIALLTKRFAGHSKWANIKHTKGLKDAQRSAAFTRLGRQLKVAIQEGNSTNPKLNSRLSQVIDQAKRINMPVATINSVIKSTQLNKGNDCKPGLLEINASFSDGGGKHLFERKGIVEANIPEGSNEKEVLEIATDHAIESGAEDVSMIAPDTLRFVCSPHDVKKVETNLENLKYKLTNVSVDYIPHAHVQLPDSELDNLSNMFDKLESIEDIVKVYDNIG